MTMNDTARAVFLAHSASDRDFASRLTKALVASGADIWTDEELAPGQDAEEAVLAGLRRSNVVVFVVPEREGAGKNALAELGAAFALGKRIVAVAPNSARLHNADVGRLLSRSAVVDASALPEKDLVNAIMMPSAA